ncbi:MAG: hypothetical protein AAFV07_06180 [Bacteroidota bacterium]
MAIKYFAELSAEETDLMLQAPAIVTILIAGADDDIDKKEKNWAARLVQYRTFTSEVKLHSYYEAVQERFEGDLDTLEAGWSTETGSQDLSAKLAAVNSILPKIDSDIASLLTESWRSLAKKVAEASGGILGFGSVEEAERALIGLPMIDA